MLEVGDAGGPARQQLAELIDHRRGRCVDVVAVQAQAHAGALALGNAEELDDVVLCGHSAGGMVTDRHKIYVSTGGTLPGNDVAINNSGKTIVVYDHGLSSGDNNIYRKTVTSLGVSSKLLEPAVGAVLAKILVLVFLIIFIQRRPRGLFPQKGRAAEG